MLFFNWINQSLTKNYLLKQKFIGGGEQFCNNCQDCDYYSHLLEAKIIWQSKRIAFFVDHWKIKLFIFSTYTRTFKFCFKEAPCISSREIHSSICAYFKLSTDFRCFSLILFDETIKQLINFGFIRVLKIK